MTGAVPCADMRRYRPVILCTIGWCALYFCFLQGQAAAAFDTLDRTGLGHVRFDEFCDWASNTDRTSNTVSAFRRY